MFIDSTLYSGRPSEKRIAKEEKVYDALDALSIPYSRADHDAADTIEMCVGVEAVLGAKIVKNLFLCNSQKTKFYILIMPGEKVFKTKDLSKQINSARLSFAGAEFMEKFFDITPGSLSILGLINDVENNVTLLIDNDILKEESIGFHPCINTSTLRIKTDDILNIFVPYTKHEPTFVDLPVYEVTPE